MYGCEQQSKERQKRSGERFQKIEGQRKKKGKQNGSSSFNTKCSVYLFIIPPGKFQEAKEEEARRKAAEEAEEAKAKSEKEKGEKAKGGCDEQCCSHDHSHSHDHKGENKDAADANASTNGGHKHGKEVGVAWRERGGKVGKARRDENLSRFTALKAAKTILTGLLLSCICNVSFCDA